MFDGVRQMENNIELRKINELIKMNFLIPAYQRGYRWDDSQVLPLLEDIAEFMSTKQNLNDAFYCLQPIVMKKIEDNHYEVIDGQQRLTTIFLIHKYLNRKTFSIEYVTREGSKDYLENIQKNVDKPIAATNENNNVDFYYMQNAYKTIRKWFVEKSDEENTFEDEFHIELGKNCKIIWCEVSDDADAETIFTRLNIGKISLTNAELVKALFLRAANIKEPNSDIVNLRRLEIAAEWDKIENTLRDNRVWYFINPRYEKDKEPITRIEYLLDVISNKKISEDDEFFTFRHFSNKIAEYDSLTIWRQIQDRFRIIMEWYNDSELFHLIGFLTSISKVRMSDLISTYYNKSFKKKEFIYWLKEDQIKGYFAKEFENVNKNEAVSKFDISMLNFNDNSTLMKHILLLFNIIATMNNCNVYSRFPFDSYHQKDWSLEHIHAQNSEDLRGNEKWMLWISDHLKSFKKFNSNKKEYRKVIKLLEDAQSKTKNITEDECRQLFDNISNSIAADYGTDLHNIDNIALLEKNLNSELNNSFFDVKRKKIIEMEQRGEFIPICTRNVFLKYYSKDPEHIHYWTETDRSDYCQKIRDTLMDYLPK